MKDVDIRYSTKGLLITFLVISIVGVLLGIYGSKIIYLIHINPIENHIMTIIIKWIILYIKMVLEIQILNI